MERHSLRDRNGTLQKRPCFRFQVPTRVPLSSTNAVLILLGLGLVGGLACNDAVEPNDVVASVTVYPPSVALVFLGATAQLDATAYDANGNILSVTTTGMGIPGDAVLGGGQPYGPTADCNGDGRVSVPDLVCTVSAKE